MKPHALLVALALTGCSAAPPSAMMIDSCRSQMPAGYAVADTLPVGSLTVHVVDERGVLLPKASVQAIGPNEGYHLTCLAGANAETGGNGIAVLERMKVGSYRVTAYRVSGDQTLGADTFATIESNKATTVTLVVKRL